jgi:hypothetical protein
MRLFRFDGYTWLRDGVPIGRGRVHHPNRRDVSRRLACRVTITYPRPFLVSASAISSTETVAPVGG